jgi:aryl-alcohol dehydrogenase-like predicted oxidoreductase
VRTGPFADHAYTRGMRYVEIEGMRLSRIGLGTWQFGTREWGYGEHYATVVAPELLRRAAELGITMIDTAEGYGPARSERIIGETLRSLPPDARAGLVVATKFTPIAPAEPVVAWQVAGSRRRLGMDALDLLYVHWKNPFVSPRRVMQSVRPLVESGAVRRAGVSNFTLAAWQEAERALRAPVVANQVQLSLASPGPTQDLVPYAAAMGRVVVAYSPLGQGLLAGRSDWSSGRFGRPQARRARRRPGLDAMQAVLAEVATAHGATPAQVALAWVVSHPNTIAIPGARTIEQLEENAAAADLELLDEELARLTEASRAFAGA